ncbi:MAG TPA: radical SAM protein [Candidatus Ozemobacteraceae bacterium]|nr:radical SAM protein [Candidatus Ozemobacteraceae bacterium]HQG29476.1 radical SAM protein [Candidatus Ozemobacteraceae bacterium]
MLKPIFLTGFPKLALYLRVVVHVFLRYLGETLRGRLGPVAFVKLLYRSLLLLKVMVRNKVVQVGELYKMQLYLPAYPSPAFWESFEKFIRPDPGPLTVVFSITKACRYKCPHCYQRNDGGADIEIELLKKVAREMQEIGVTMFDIEGGEPLLRFERLMDLLTAFDGRREIWVNTTGEGLTPEMARRMKEAGVFGVMISLHTPDPVDYDAFTRFPGSFGIAKEAARMFNEAGITVALNSCPTEELFARDGVERVMDVAREWGCSFVQIIHGKSAGAWLGKQDEMISAREKIRKLRRLHLQYNSPGAFAGHPSASVQVFEESPCHFGCTAGGVDRFYLNANGEVQPCEFLNVSFGNVQEEGFKTIFARMRRQFRQPGTRWLCATEAGSIHKTIVDKGLRKTPVPREFTEKLVETWNKGSPTDLYRRMNLYKPD